jgi:hypothetical protein
MALEEMLSADVISSRKMQLVADTISSPFKARKLILDDKDLRVVIRPNFGEETDDQDKGVYVGVLIHVRSLCAAGSSHGKHITKWYDSPALGFSGSSIGRSSLNLLYKRHEINI